MINVPDDVLRDRDVLVAQRVPAPSTPYAGHLEKCAIPSRKDIAGCSFDANTQLRFDAVAGLGCLARPPSIFMFHPPHLLRRCKPSNATPREEFSDQSVRTIHCAGVHAPLKPKGH